MRFHSVSVLAAAAISTLCACHAELPQKANNDASLDADFAALLDADVALGESAMGLASQEDAGGGGGGGERSGGGSDVHDGAAAAATHGDSAH